MQMTDEEILASFRQAANKREQVGVLADLNCVSKKDMAMYLRDLGAEDVPQALLKVSNGRRVSPEVEQKIVALCLANPRATDQEIAERCGVSKSKVCTVRHDNGMRKQSGWAQNAPVPPIVDVMGPSVLSQILDDVSQMFPSAIVKGPADGPVCGADLSVTYGAKGEAVNVVLKLKSAEECGGVSL